MLVSAADCDLLPPFDFLSSEKKNFSPSSTDFNAVDEEVLLREDTPDGGPPLQRTRTRVVRLTNLQHQTLMIEGP